MSMSKVHHRAIRSVVKTVRIASSTLPRRFAHGISSDALASSCSRRQFSSFEANYLLYGRTIPSYTSISNRHFSKKLIPRKAALNLTPKARETFQKLISATNSQGIMLRYEISSQHALRMAFKFDLIKDSNELSAEDEG